MCKGGECQEIVVNCICKHVYLCENIEDNLYFYNVFMPMEPVKHLPVLTSNCF